VSATVGMSKNFSANQVISDFILIYWCSLVTLMQFGKVYTELLDNSSSTISSRKCL